MLSPLVTACPFRLELPLPRSSTCVSRLAIRLRPTNPVLLMLHGFWLPQPPPTVPFSNPAIRRTMVPAGWFWRVRHAHIKHATRSRAALCHSTLPKIHTRTSRFHPSSNCWPSRTQTLLALLPPPSPFPPCPSLPRCTLTLPNAQLPGIRDLCRLELRLHVDQSLFRRFLSALHKLLGEPLHRPAHLGWPCATTPGVLPTVLSQALRAVSVTLPCHPRSLLLVRPWCPH